GKVYNDLLEERARRFRDPATVALIRIEQLYPWPVDDLAALTQRYSRATQVVWVQEEPANMGAWTFVRERIQAELRPTQKLAYAGRPESASPATGSMRIHRVQLAELLDCAFARLSES
ncbi:MAG: 2-oxoglutarate dehydrogenase E1 component, partial [Myxococcota bacterium]